MSDEEINAILATVEGIIEELIRNYPNHISEAVEFTYGSGELVRIFTDVEQADVARRAIAFIYALGGYAAFTKEEYDFIDRLQSCHTQPPRK